MIQLQSVLGFPWSSHRKLMACSPASAPMVAERIPPSGSYLNEVSLDADLIVMLAALGCALICGLGINLLFKCAMRSSRRMMLDSSEELANTGLMKAAMKALPIIVCTATSNPPALLMDCPICLTEFADGEKLRLIPDCSHSFHVDCIDQWLLSHSSCPVCRHCLDLHVENRKPEGALILGTSESSNTVHMVIDQTNTTLSNPRPLSEIESSFLHI